MYLLQLSSMGVTMPISSIPLGSQFFLGGRSLKGSFKSLPTKYSETCL